MRGPLGQVDRAALGQHDRAEVLLDPYLDEQLLRRRHVNRQVDARTAYRLVVLIDRFKVGLIVCDLAWREFLLDVLRKRLAALPGQPVQPVETSVPSSFNA